MKKHILIFILLSAAIVGCKKDKEQSPAPIIVKGCMDTASSNYNPIATEDDGSCNYLTSSEEKNKMVLLEDFTGVQCTYCPKGHRNSESYSAAHPGKIIIIATQTANPNFGTPYEGEQNLQTGFAAELESNAKVKSWPGGTINRTIFSNSKYPIDTTGGMAMLLTNVAWYDAANEISAQKAPLNIGTKTIYDSLSRIVNITVETYYTSTITEDIYLVAAITESNIIVKQIDLGVQYARYKHHHVLRTYLNTPWGEKITSPTTIGTRTKRTFAYTVPSNYNSKNCKVVVFVSEFKKNILNAEEVPLD